MQDSIFQEPSEKGFNEVFGPTEKSLTGKDIAFLVFMLVIFVGFVLFTLNSAVASPQEATGPDYAPQVSEDIVERDGVLYYPGGQPVRNYEQMLIYLQSK